MSKESLISDWWMKNKFNEVVERPLNVARPHFFPPGYSLKNERPKTNEDSNEWLRDCPIICLPRIWVRPPCMLVSTWGLLTESGWLKDHKEKDGQVYILKHLQNWETNKMTRSKSWRSPFRCLRVYEDIKPQHFC